MKIDLTPEQVALVVATAAVGKSADTAIVYPYRDPDPRAQGHLFATREEHDAWRKAIQQRDAALDQWGVDYSTPGSPEWPLLTEEQENAMLTRFDAEPNEAFQFYQFGLGNGEYSALLSRWTRTMGADARSAIRNKINQYNGFAPPQR